jgi:dihydroorotate dehydrogenase electron transfer subunit
MMRQEKLKVTANEKILHDVYFMRLSGDCSGISRAGRFIDIRIEGFFLRRPISIYDYTDKYVDILYKTVGAGTDALAETPAGAELDVLLPLGNGFDISKRGGKNLLVGGGIGLPPIYSLAKEFVSQGMQPVVIAGFNTSADILPMERFHEIGIDPVIATADGSVGVKGFVTDAMKLEDYDYVFCCGPKPMLKAVYDASPDGQFSFEERMGCGFGACMGCSIETKHGPKRVCADGPVFFRDDIIW